VDPVRRCGVLGDPIAHSLSPVLHRAGYAALGLAWQYDAHRVASGGLAEFLAGLDGSWRGLSLTMPLKREAMAVVDAASDRAVLAGAANTLVVGPDGVRGDNTDLPGAMAAIRERYAGPLDRTVIWGGGATAASVLLAVAELGCRDVQLLVRDPVRATETLAAADRFREPLSVRVGALGSPVEADLLVSTIPAEPQTGLVGSIGRVAAVFDVLYHPWPTPLARWARDHPLIGGLDLLVHQAALQFELFTELPAPLAAMRDAGRAALAERT
jgi:shikimate dehydrogenase